MGTIIPAYLGNPSLDNYAFTTFASTLHGALTGAAGLPVKVILSIHTPSADVWTESSAAYKVCYKAGEACPLSHAVCSATYCEIDRWNQIIAELKEVTNVQVTEADCRLERSKL